jgi:hypothetical protein
VWVFLHAIILLNAKYDCQDFFGGAYFRKNVEAKSGLELIKALQSLQGLHAVVTSAKRLLARVPTLAPGAG